MRLIGIVCVVVVFAAGCGGDNGGTTEPATPGLKASARAMTLDPQGTVLEQPITVEMPFSPADLDELGIADASSLLVYEYDAAAGRWKEVQASTVDASRGVVVFTTSVLSSYRLGAKSF
jgi:hypothetical protein